MSYLERVNAELSELLDRCDAETLTAQSTLECDKRELSSHNRALQDEVSRLQERCAVLLGDLEEQRSARAAAGGLRASAVGVGGEAAVVASGKQALGDRELMLRQIESVKLVRGVGGGTGHMQDATTVCKFSCFVSDLLSAAPGFIAAHLHSSPCKGVCTDSVAMCNELHMCA